MVAAQPDPTPLAWYYLPAGLRYATSLGPVKDPSYMDWVDALKRLQHANPRRPRIRWLLASSPASSCSTCDR